MNTEWSKFLASAGFNAENSDFGDGTGELLAARDGAVIVPLLDQGLIRASGPDAADFLHNLLSNDVNGIDASSTRIAGLCTAKGRLLATLLIWRDGDDLLLMLPADIHAAILKKLSMYVLRSKVKLSDATNDVALIGVSVQGAVPPGLTFGELAAIGETKAADALGGKSLRLDSTRWLLAVPVGSAATTWSHFANVARPVGIAAWQWLEIAAGTPRVVAATQEAFVPQMLNMELPAVGGVSFTKGCYPGQEIVARTQYLGKVKRRMYRARLPQPIAPGTHLYAPETGDQHCGAIVSVAPSPDGQFEALVCVQSAAVDAGEVHAERGDGPRLEFLTLPYSLGA